jgi:hypothetical protein
MAEFFRILAALFALYFHLLASGPFRPLPIVIATSTATAAPSPTATLPPSPTPSRTNTASPSATSTRTLTATPSATPSRTPTFTATSSPSRTATRTATWTATSTGTFTPTATRTASATFTITATPTVSATPTVTNTPRPTPTPSSTATAIPTAGPSSTDPLGVAVVGVPPAQTLPAALLIYPLVRTSSTQETRVEIMNLSLAPVSLQCFYVASSTCSELGFFLRLTANQPVSWFASTGMSGSATRVAPPFLGDGELKCAVVAATSDVSSYNTVQGRALLSDSTGQTIGYNAIAFRRLSPGPYSGTLSLDGVTYEQCPDRLHFHGLTSVGTGPDSELDLVPCSEDLVTQSPSGANVQIAVINELEQHFSGATTLKCFNRISFGSIPALRRSTAGTDTAHVIVRGVDVPVIGLVIERFAVGSGAPSTSANEPDLEGGRSATISLP